MEKLTYRQAYDKIIDAYFKDEIKPMDSKFCFCGTLSPDLDWNNDHELGAYPYTRDEYLFMEDALFDGIYKLNGRQSLVYLNSHPRYEDALFSGMTAALEVLKQIHRDRGEDVDEIPGLVKRDLARTV